MTDIGLSIAIGVGCGVAMLVALRRAQGLHRVRRTVTVGVPVLVLMTAWTLWRGSFPGTFGPFVLLCVLTAQRDRV